MLITNRPLYVMKFHSSRLKEFDYNINNSFEELKELNEIIGLSDNQILRTIRDVNKRTINKEKLEILIKIKNYYKKRLNKNKEYNSKIKQKVYEMKSKEKYKNNKIIENIHKKINKNYYFEQYNIYQNKIYKTCFDDNYVVIVMDSQKQYKYLFNNGLIINNKKYERLSCSAGQARVSTVVFCNTNIIKSVEERLNNGRDLNKKISPSKFNAYFGLSGSATKIVSEPKFIVVKDFENKVSFKVNYVIENGEKYDDTIVEKELKDVSMNRTDGMGLISPKQAEIWSKDLGLDYIPSQFCIRQNFMKGMLCVFEIHRFCEEINGGNFIVNTIYKDLNGNYIKVDLREYDVIITESQFKLWDSFKNIENYIENYRKNKLFWGVSLTSPKESKRILKLNYQFIQTLKLTQEEIEKLAEQFVYWIKNVSYDNYYYMILFLLGVNNDEEKIKSFLKSNNNYWIKALLLNEDIKDDIFIKSKIKKLIQKKIENGCKGDIYVDGNFQPIVSDPYGFMQHVCGLEVSGLLENKKYYSNYWNEKNIKKVNGMRSPLTYLSEHVIMDLQKDENTEKWYKYCKSGIILNYHGHETFNLGGCDFDYDIIATTSSSVIIKGVYDDELPVTYKIPKPEKINFNKNDLYKSDTFSFGSIIGSITNKSSNAYAMLPLAEEKYGINSTEYKLLKSRLQQCCKAQSCQIDKAKIGKEVKGIPKVWIQRNKIKKNKKGKTIEKKIRKKEIYNNTLLKSYPYFFKYIYRDTSTKYKKYVDEYNIICKQKYNMDLKELENIENKTSEQINFIENFYEYCPVIVSNSSMNILCKYIENINFNISSKIKTVNNKNIVNLYKNNEIESEKYYEQVVKCFKNFISEQKNKMIENNSGENDHNEFQETIEFNSNLLLKKLIKINPNVNIILNCLIDYHYINNTKSNKTLLWTVFGKYICDNIKNNSNSNKILFPFPCEDEEHDLQYLNYNYKLKEIEF